MDIEDVQVPRKTVIAGLGVGAAAVTLAACSSGPDSGSDSDSSSGSGSPTPGEPLASTTDVPVGLGVIVGDVVITQPVEGEFTGLSAVCTHSGCLVNEIVDGTINCPCHGSKYDLEGQVVNGPATKPLPPVGIELQGDSIVEA